jgi:hypothetical protein
LDIGGQQRRPRKEFVEDDDRRGAPQVNQLTMSDQALEELQRATFGYFLKETNPANGLVPENTRQGSHCSITAVGLALACYAIGVERGFVSRAQAIERTLTTLRFFRDSPQSEDTDATG